jgi:hypothetical protein
VAANGVVGITSRSLASAVTNVENKAYTRLFNNLQAILNTPGISFRELLCYRAIENQNVLMMFLVAAR